MLITQKEMLCEGKLLQVFQDCDVILKGHFRLTRGRHSDTYLEKNALFVRPKMASDLCESIAHRFRNDGVEVVIGAATGAIILSAGVAYHLEKMCGRTIYSIYADREGPGFVIKRGFEKYISGKHALVVEDIITTGGTVQRVITLARSAGTSHIVGVGAICSRNPEIHYTIDNVPLRALLRLDLESYSDEDCPDWLNKIPISREHGKGPDYVATIAV